MAEELRVLYVAMTRAREKLIITASYKDAEKEIAKILSSSGRRSETGGHKAEASGQEAGSSRHKIAPQALAEIKSMAGWILAASGSPEHKTNEFMHISICSPPPPEADPVKRRKAEHVPGLEAQTPDISIQSGEEQADITRFSYPHSLAPGLPSKLTVTGLKGRSIVFDAEAQVLYNEPEAADDSGGALTAKKRFATVERPDFITKKTGLTAAERGTALHLALQHIDFRACGDESGVGVEVRLLGERSVLTEAQVSAVDIKKLTRFFESDIGARVRKAEKIWREFKFSLLYPAERFFEGGGDDEILLQGVVDCFIEEEGELTVVDFKTDHVTAETTEAKARYYAPQLAAYADALERITGKSVREKMIYFFAIDECRAI